MAYQHSCAIFAIGDLSNPNPVLLMKLHNIACLLYWNLLITCNSSWGCYYIYKIIHQYKFFNSCNFTLLCIKSILKSPHETTFFIFDYNLWITIPYYLKIYESPSGGLYIQTRMNLWSISKALPLLTPWNQHVKQECHPRKFVCCSWR